MAFQQAFQGLGDLRILVLQREETLKVVDRLVRLACDVAGRLGLERASHLEGGFTAWKEAGGEVAPYVKKKR